jgi:hypothetical protein
MVAPALLPNQPPSATCRLLSKILAYFKNAPFHATDKLMINREGDGVCESFKLNCTWKNRKNGSGISSGLSDYFGK